MSIDHVSFIRGLAITHPIFAPVLRVHLEENGEILPHVLLADYTRTLIEKFESSASRDREDVASVLDDLDGWYERAEELRGLIALSFLFNLPGKVERGGGIRGLLGPHLRDQLRSSNW